MDRILNSKSFKLLKKYRSNLVSISLLAFLIWRDYINGEGNTFFVGVMFILLSLCIITTITDIVLSFFIE